MSQRVVITFEPSIRPAFADRPFLLKIGSSHIRLSSDDLDAVLQDGTVAIRESRGEDTQS